MYVWSFKLFVLHSYYAQKHMGTIIIYCFNNLQHKKGMLAGSSFCTPPKNQWNHFQPLKRTVGNHLSLTIIMIIILLSIADGLCANFLSSYHILTSSVIYYWPDAQCYIESIWYLNTMTGVHVYSKLHSCPKMTYCSKHKEVISKFIL